MEEQRTPEDKERVIGTNESVNSMSTPPVEVSAPLPELSEAQAQQMVISALKAKADNASSWFFWIAGFALITSLVSLTGMGFVFFFGLGVTRIIDVMARLISHSDKTPPVAILFDLIPIGFYFLIGNLSKKAWGWLVVGMVFFLIDGLMLFLLKQPDWIGIAAHGYVLFILWQGLSAARAARNLEKIAAAGA